MSEVDDLVRRIDEEFASASARIEEFQAEKVHEYQERKKRLEEFEDVIDHLQDVVRPRLQALAKRFGDQVEMSPRIEPERREVKFSFKSQLATIQLKFSVRPDADVRNVNYAYDLSILPIFIKFNGHQSVSFPLDGVDKEAVGAWIDDRIVEFIRTYFSIYENHNYLKEHLVVDPVADVQFPDFVSAAELEWKGKKYHFISTETRDEFIKLNGIKETRS